MESLETISKIEIPVKSISYDKKSKILSIDILGFVFVGYYKKSVKIGALLDEIYASLGDTTLQRKDICILGANNLLIPESNKLRDLNLSVKKEEKKQKKFNIKDIQAVRGGGWNAEETQVDFKVRIQNNSSFIIENIQILLTSIPYGFELEHDKYKINRLKPNSFESHTFIMNAEAGCIGGTIKAKVIFPDPKGNQQTKEIAPFEIPSSLHFIAPKKTEELKVELVASLEEKKEYKERRRDEAKKTKQKRRLVSAEEEMTEDEELNEGEMLSESKIAKEKKKGLISAEDKMVEDEEYEVGEILSDDISYLKTSEAEKAEIAAPTSRGAPQQAPGEMGGGPEPETGATPKAPEPALAKPVIEPEEPKPTTYNINMGFQYYSVMMEQKSYLFYVYLSHEELKILDEEGKTVYKTTFTITTLKKEPPVLDLRIEGEGFDIHPLTGKIVVKKDAVNPPVMIFSILPLKQMKKKKGRKKKSERRYLNVYIEFEEKIINHTVLSVIVQPKHFHLDLGPIQIDISKRTAFFISFVSVLVATISTIFSAITLETTSLVDIMSGFAPGLASFIFFAVFIITLIKNGIYPLKQKWSALLKFDKGIVMMK